MKIVSIHEATVPLRSAMRNAYIDFNEMTVSIVAVMTDRFADGEPIVGFGFNSIGRYAQGSILSDRLIPRLLKADPEEIADDRSDNLDPFKAWRTMMANEKPGGHGERSSAVGALDMALWDLVAKAEAKPLHAVIADRYGAGATRSDVAVYAAGGYYYGGHSLTRLQDELRGYLDLGFEAVKIKIGGASLSEDLSRIEAAIEVVGDAGALAVDANGKLRPDQAMQYLQHLNRYGLRWYEEAADPLDYAHYAELSAASTIPLATGENLFSRSDTVNLLRYAGLVPERDFLQVDPSLSYGLVEYLGILQELDRHGWSRSRCFPHGGHPFLLHVAAGLGLGGVELYPGVFEPFGGAWNGVAIADGRISLPTAPGIGFEQKPALIDVLRSCVRERR